jgi:hypothetical protein
MDEMNTVAKCAAIASVVLLTAGSAAWAQSYGNSGSYGNQGANQGYSQNNQGNFGNQGAYGNQTQYGNPGYNQNANSGNWGNNQSIGARECRAPMAIKVTGIRVRRAAAVNIQKTPAPVTPTIRIMALTKLKGSSRNTDTLTFTIYAQPKAGPLTL